jgi:hypothetical protein
MDHHQQIPPESLFLDIVRWMAIKFLDLGMAIWEWWDPIEGLGKFLSLWVDSATD